MEKLCTCISIYKLSPLPYLPVLDRLVGITDGISSFPLRYCIALIDNFRDISRGQVKSRLRIWVPDIDTGYWFSDHSDLSFEPVTEP